MSHRWEDTGDEDDNDNDDDAHEIDDYYVI